MIAVEGGLMLLWRRCGMQIEQWHGEEVVCLNCLPCYKALLVFVEFMECCHFLRLYL